MERVKRVAQDSLLGTSLIVALGLAVAGAGCRGVAGEGRERPVPTKAKARRGGSPESWRAKLEVAQHPQLSSIARGFDTERLWGDGDDWEPAVAVAPGGDVVYQMATRYSPGGGGGAPDPAMIFRRSPDGGRSWEADTFLDFVNGTQNDPILEAATGGIVYAAWLHGYVPGVKVARSTDFGVSWSSPVTVVGPGGPPSWSDKPVLACSRDGRDVYVAFNASDSYVAASHDYGQTFAPPVRTNTDNRYWFHTAGAVGPGGEVFFGATDYSQNYHGNARVRLLRSSDGGASWSTSLVDVSAELPDCNWSPSCPFGFLGPSVGLAVDPAGVILVAYNAGNTPGEEQMVYVRTSADGVSWSGRVALSTAGAGVDHAFPAVAAGPTPGDFRVVWQDDRNGTDRWNSWYRRTRDGGASWLDEVRLSDLARGAPYKHPEGYLFPYGDYLELDVDDAGTTHVIWGEGTNWIGRGGAWYSRGE